ncbi:conserved hypothetical protein [delta proteobacterium NaphS2]|nr:conserved hypothetical protein [delta proteobacterium NaphS2]
MPFFHKFVRLCYTENLYSVFLASADFKKSSSGAEGEGYHLCHRES